MTHAERVTVAVCRAWPVVGSGHRLDEQVAVVVANRVVAVSAEAERADVVVGLRRREAQRRAPGLQIVEPDPGGEARAYEPVLLALEDITPRIEIDRPGTCAFLARGPSRYFGGDQAMSDRVATTIAEALEGATTVHVGTADSRFAAMRAAATAGAGQARVVPVGASEAFLAPMPVRALAMDLAPGPMRREVVELVDVLTRLGLVTLGAFASLGAADVVARFGATGERAHQWAKGMDQRPLAAQDPPAELEVALELDPVVERVDQAAFAARSLAETFLAGLQARGASCARVGIHVETEHGEQRVRLWRSEEAFSATAIADRMRWQLDGWLAGPERQRPTGGLSRLAIRPDDLSVAAGRQLGFWGEETGLAERAARSIARVQGLAGMGVVWVPEAHGGRSAADGVRLVPAESVDLVDRSVLADQHLVGAQDDPAAGVASDFFDGRWPGRLPRPTPTRLFDPPVAVEMADADGRPVTVTGRGLMRSAPAVLTLSGRSKQIVGWSAPWLLDERWWRSEGNRRSARLQVVTDDGGALLVTQQGGRWYIEAAFD